MILPWSSLWSYAVANGIGSMRLLATVTGEHRRQLIRWKDAGGITEDYEACADRLAAALGAHPLDIWPEEWAAIEAERFAAEEARRRAMHAATKRAYRAANPDYVARQRAYRAAYYKTAGDFERARQRRYYSANADKERARVRAYDERQRSEGAA